MAGAWAILNFLGEEGYKRIVKEVQEATRKLIAGINAMDDLQVLDALPDELCNVFLVNYFNDLYV